MVKTLLTTTKTNAENLDKISVCTGPGSFTGVRVGLSFAKGLALPWHIPVVGVSGLEAWAHSADPEHARAVFAIADVRRGDVYWQRFESGAATAKPVLSSVEKARKALKSNDLVVGSGAGLLNAPAQEDFISPAILAWMGLERTVDISPAEPLYHRPPDAKLPGGKSL